MTFLSRRIATSAAAATLLAALSVPTLAQTPPPGPQARSEQMQEMRKERMENWAAKFKQQLQLTPAQEGAWSTYMEAMKPREHARLGTDWKDLRALPTPDASTACAPCASSTRPTPTAGARPPRPFTAS